MIRRLRRKPTPRSKEVMGESLAGEYVAAELEKEETLPLREK